MKPVLVLLLTVLTAATLLAAGTDAGDLEAVEEVAGLYLEGARAGDPELMRQAFHESARLQGVRDGRYRELPIADYIAGTKPSEGRAGMKSRVLSVDCAGTAALVKVEEDFGTVVYVDYLSLLKIDGRWWIVNKSYDAQRP